MNPMTTEDYKKWADSWLEKISPGTMLFLDYPIPTGFIYEPVSDAASLFEEIHGYASPQYTEQKGARLIMSSSSQTSLRNLLASKK